MGGTTNLTRWRGRMCLTRGGTRSAAGLLRGPRPGPRERVVAASPAGVGFRLLDVRILSRGWRPWLGSSLTLTGHFGRFFPTSVAAVFWLGVLVPAARRQSWNRTRRTGFTRWPAMRAIWIRTA